MKRGFTTALILIAATIAVNAQSIDFTVDESASFTHIEDPSASVTQDVSASFVLPLGAKTRITGKYGLELGYDYVGASGSTTFDYPDSVADLLPRELGFYYASPLEDEGLKNFALSIGRIPYADPTGALFSYKVDGFLMEVVYPLVTVRTLMGYTGFLSDSSTIIANTADATYGNDDFAPPRGIMGFGLKTPRIASYEFYSFVLAQEDFRNDAQFIPEYETVADSTSGGPADAAYAGAGFSGSLGSKIGISAYGVYQFGRSLSYLPYALSETEKGNRYEYAARSAYTFGASVRAAFSPKINAIARIQYGSGDEDASGPVDGNTAGDATQFTPITTSASGLVFSPEPGNVSLLEVTLAYVPFPAETIGSRALRFTGKSFLFAKNGEGPVDEAGIDPSAGAGLLGFEEDLSASLRLLSDLTFNVSVGVFYPVIEPAGAFFESYTENMPVKYSVRASVSLAL